MKQSTDEKKRKRRESSVFKEYVICNVAKLNSSYIYIYIYIYLLKYYLLAFMVTRKKKKKSTEFRDNNIPNHCLGEKEKKIF